MMDDTSCTRSVRPPYASTNSSREQLQGNQQHQRTACEAHHTAAYATSQDASRAGTLQRIANVRAVWLGTCRVRFPVPGFPANRARRSVVEARRLESWLEGSPRTLCCVGLTVPRQGCCHAFQLCHDLCAGSQFRRVEEADVGRISCLWKSKPLHVN